MKPLPGEPGCVWVKSGHKSGAGHLCRPLHRSGKQQIDGDEMVGVAGAVEAAVCREIGIKSEAQQGIDCDAERSANECDGFPDDCYWHWTEGKCHNMTTDMKTQRSQMKIGKAVKDIESLQDSEQQELTQLLADMEKRIKTKGLSVCLNQDQSKQGGKTMARFFGLGAMLPSLLEIAKQGLPMIQTVLGILGGGGGGGEAAPAPGGGADDYGGDDWGAENF